MSGILRLESLTKGNTLKQGDKTPLKYRLFDADGEKLNIAGKSAKVRLVYPDFLTIGYEKDGLTVAQDDTVTFTIDGVIPSRIYHVEIIVDDKFIFPSRADEAKFTVDKSSLGTESNIVEIVGVDAVVRKAVDLINADPSLIIDEDKLVGDIISNTGIGSINDYYQAFNDLKPRAELSISKSAEALTKSQNALNVANGIDHKATNALSKSDNAVIKANEAKSKSDSVQSQLNGLVLMNGDSSPEINQAKVDLNGVLRDTLKERIDDDISDVSTNLRKTTFDMYEGNLNNKVSLNSKPRAMLAIQDDDTNKRLYTEVFPILKELNVPITAGAITGRIDQHSDTITLDEYYEMQDSGLVEFVSHTVTHRNIATGMQLHEAEEELVQSKNWLIEHGGNPYYFIPPFGGDSPETVELIRKHYKASFKTFSAGYITNPPVMSTAVRRSDFEVTKVDLPTQKSRLNEALQSNSLIVVNTHSGYTTFDKDDFRELLEYAISIGLDIVTTSEAMNHFGNLFELSSIPNDANYGVIDANGNTHGKLGVTYFIEDATNIKVDTPRDFLKFKRGVTVANFGSSLASQYGWPSAGTLFTHNYSPTFAFQRFVPFDSPAEFQRYWNGSGWGEFKQISGESYVRNGVRTGVTNETPITDFKQGVTITHYTRSLATEYNLPGSGVLITVNQVGVGYGYQRFINIQSYEELHRYSTSTGWSEWLPISSNQNLSTVNINNLDTSKIPKGYQVYNGNTAKPVWWSGTAWRYADGSAM